MRQLLRVAVLIESSRSYGRGLIEGISKYSRLHGPWSMYFEPQGLGAAPPGWLTRWDGDGILARIDDQRMAAAVLATGAPALDLRGRLSGLPLPFIGGDNEAITKMAFDHLKERGLRRFAFCGVAAGQMKALDLRREWFVRHVQSAGCECDVFTSVPRFPDASRAITGLSGATPAIDFGSMDWEAEQAALAGWVAELPKPIGIMACHDPRGYQLIDACRRAEVIVPDEVAVVGVDNDAVLCSMANPPMTSIDIDGERVGYEAAAWLNRMMHGEPGPPKPVLIPPLRLIPRRSSDMLAINDPDIAKAIRFIRDHACDGVRVDAVVRHVAMSRSVLERRFKDLIGRTLKSELLRVQIDRAKQLLAATNLPLAAIASQTGFASEKYFSDVFFRETSQRPTSYRRSVRPTGGDVS